MDAALEEALPPPHGLGAAGWLACKPSPMTNPEVRTTALPGVGDRHDFTTADGEQIGVVRHRDGDRELLVFSHEDPDACEVSLRLRGEDARLLSLLLAEGSTPTGA